MKKLLMIAVALFFVSCAHTSKEHACSGKDAKHCKMDKKKCDSKECKVKKKKCDSKKCSTKKGHDKMSAEECDLNTCKIHRSKK